MAKEDKFPIVVSESGLHICVDDILTWDEAMELIYEIQNALFKYRKLIGKSFEKTKPDAKGKS
jgi:predicted TIM-barrel fold metal-dependent hydrolase